MYRCYVISERILLSTNEKKYKIKVTPLLPSFYQMNVGFSKTNMYSFSKGLSLRKIFYASYEDRDRIKYPPKRTSCNFVWSTGESFIFQTKKPSSPA